MVGSESDEEVSIVADLDAQLDDAKMRGLVGDFGVEGFNDNGKLMLEMCLQNEVALCNNSLKKRSIHRKSKTG